MWSSLQSCPARESLMCFSAPVSIAAYVVGTVGCTLLYRSGLFPECFFYLWVVQMQLVEFFMHMNPMCNAANALATRIGIIVNHTEVTALWLGVLLFNGRRRPLPRWLNAFMFAFSVATVFYTGAVLGDQCCTVVDALSFPHLHWRWNDFAFYSTYYYLSFLFAMLALAYHGLDHGAWHASIALLSYVVSYCIYGKLHAVGAVWCVSASLAPLLEWAKYELFDKGEAAARIFARPRRAKPRRSSALF